MRCSQSTGPLAGFLLLAAAACPARAAEPAPPGPPDCAADSRQRPPDPRCGERLDGRAPVPADSSLAVPRAVLWVPRASARVLLWPVLETGDAVEYHHMIGWMENALTTDDRLIGVRPEITYATSFLPTAGVRLFDYRLPGQGSALTGRFLTGGPSVILSELQLRGPDRLGLVLSGAFNRRHDRLFAGIGPNSEAELQAAGRGLARYGSDIWTVDLRWTRPLPAWLFVTLHGDLGRRDNEASVVHGGPSVADVYGLPPDGCAAIGLPAPCVDPAQMPGFERGLRIAHAGLGLTLDHRSRARDGGGITLVADATLGQGIAGDPTQIVTTSLESVVALGGTDRALFLRGRAAMVDAFGSAPVPFDQLIIPSGAAGMRGFPEGRFRGQSGVVGTAEYRYYIASSLDASVFTDIGTVAGPRFAGLGWDHWFPTFGVGLRAYTPSGPHWEAPARTGVQLAYAPDNGLRLLLSLAAF